MKPTERITVVGDNRQAIFGFRGADSNSLDRLKQELNADELGLTRTYRCGKVIVERAQGFVPDLEADENNPDGEIVEVNTSKIVDMAGPNTKILPGHGVVSTRDDVARFRDNTIEAQRRITDLIKQGMTLEQVVAANPTADLAPKFITTASPPDKAATDRFLTAFYNACKSEL